MKPKSLIKLCLSIVGLLTFLNLKASQTLTVCNCSNLSYTCSYVITVNIQACDKNGLNCVSMVPQTRTITPGTCYTFTFNPPTGKSLVYSSASFNVSSTGGWSSSFGSTSTDATGNCFNASGSGGQVTHWTANGTSTSYTICPDLIVCCMRMTLVSPGINSSEVNETNKTKSAQVVNPAGEVTFSDAYTVYPNPSYADAYLSISSSKIQNVKVNIFDSRNMPVYSLNKELHKGEEIIQLEGLSTGIYYLVVQTENDVITKHFSIQK